MLARIRSASPKVVAVTGVVALVALGGGSAAAASLLTGKDIKNGSLTGADIRSGSVSGADIKNGSLHMADLSPSAIKSLRGKTTVQGRAGRDGANGAKGDKGDKGDGASVGLPNWGVVHRNVIANGSSTLATESQKPPLGQGALDIRTGPVIAPNSGDKAAFGNETDYAGNLLSSLTRLGFSVFTTGENIAGGGTSPNMPSLGIEVDPTGSAATAPNFSTLVFVPKNTAANTWTAIDATDAATGFQGGGWFYTGASGTASHCNQTTLCTFAQAKAAFPDAVIGSVQITKGRDFAFSGAVDALVVNAQTFDFEASGVFLH